MQLSMYVSYINVCTNPMVKSRVTTQVVASVLSCTSSLVLFKLQVESILGRHGDAHHGLQRNLRQGIGKAHSA